MAFIVIDKDKEEMGGLRSEMRRRYRGNYRNYGNSSANMREHYYKKGYEHAIEDMADEDMEMGRHYDTMGNTYR